jgi:hypothetical protein
MSWEREALRGVQGQTENGYWGVEVNQDVYKEFKSQGIVIVFKVRRLEWLGCSRTVRRLLDSRPGAGDVRLRLIGWTMLNWS